MSDGKRLIVAKGHLSQFNRVVIMKGTNFTWWSIDTDSASIKVFYYRIPLVGILNCNFVGEMITPQERQFSSLH